jgi:hypothetical protein
VLRAPPGERRGGEQAEHRRDRGVAQRLGLGGPLGHLGALEELDAGAVQRGVDGDLVGAPLDGDELGDRGVALGLEGGVGRVGPQAGLRGADARLELRGGLLELGDGRGGVVADLLGDPVLVGLRDGVGELRGTLRGRVERPDGDEVEVDRRLGGDRSSIWRTVSRPSTSSLGAHRHGSGGDELRLVAHVPRRVDDLRPVSRNTPALRGSASSSRASPWYIVVWRNDAANP